MKRFKILVFIFALLRFTEPSGNEDDKLTFQLDDPSDPNEPDEGENDDEIVEMGDMRLLRRQLDALNEEPSRRRHGLSEAIFLWDDAIVPVKIDPKANFTSDFIKRLKSAMKQIMDVSCVKFVFENEPKSDFIHIVRDQKCASFVGNLRRGEEGQGVNVYEKCNEGNLVHELLHSVGLMHMHTFAERDKYVKILWDNIQPEQKLNFHKFIGQASMFDTDYDFDSIMHYGTNFFSKNASKPTIKALIPLSKGVKIGQRRGLSEGDILRLNRMYNCPDEPVAKNNLQQAETEELEDTEATPEKSETPDTREAPLSLDEAGKENSDEASENSKSENQKDQASDDVAEKEATDAKAPIEQEVMKIYFFSKRCQNSFSFPHADNVVQIYETESGFEVRTDDDKKKGNSNKTEKDLQQGDREDIKVQNDETTETAEAPDEDKPEIPEEEEKTPISREHVLNHLRHFIRNGRGN